MPDLRQLAQFYAPSKEVVERYAEEYRSGRQKFPDISCVRDNVGTINDPQGSLGPDHNLHLAIMLEAINNAKGESHHAKTACDECHVDKVDCGCRSYEIRKQDIDHLDEETGLLHLRRVVTERETLYAYPNQLKARYYKCRTTVRVDRCTIDENNRLWWRAIRTTCPNRPLQWECAHRWLTQGGHLFQETCDVLGIDVEYLRRQLA